MGESSSLRDQLAQVQARATNMVERIGRLSENPGVAQSAELVTVMHELHADAYRTTAELAAISARMEMEEQIRVLHSRSRGQLIDGLQNLVGHLEKSTDEIDVLLSFSKTKIERYYQDQIQQLESLLEKFGSDTEESEQPVRDSIAKLLGTQKRRLVHVSGKVF